MQASLKTYKHETNKRTETIQFFLKRKMDKNAYFTQNLLKWNKKLNKREMPWKGETDPYKIWLSEIILQQTRVEQGLEYYKKFIINKKRIRNYVLNINYK